MNDLHKAAAEMNIPVKSSDLVDRKGNVPEVGPMSGPASAAFDLATGAISGPLNAGDTGVVLQVTGKAEPSAEEIAKTMSAERQQLTEQRRAELFGVYMQTLIDNYTRQGAIRVMQKPATQSPLGI